MIVRGDPPGRIGRTPHPGPLRAYVVLTMRTRRCGYVRSRVADDPTKVRTVRRRRTRRDDADAALVADDGTRFPIAPGTTTIGRGEQADVRIDNDGLSREHAKIVCTEGIVNVVDLESTNGTYLNGERVELSLLREGDELQLGPDVVLRFTFAAAGITPPRPPGERIDALLTAREIEVARLVADGLTSAAIAERLGIRERTVGSHLDHIYTKLGIRSRAALTRRLADAGLL